MHDIPDENINELRVLLETKLGRPVSMDEARDEARALLTILLMISEIRPGDEHYPTESDPTDDAQAA